MSSHRSTVEALRAMLEASKKAEAGLREGAKSVLQGIEQRQREFEDNKKRIEDDIKRGSKLSKGRMPF